MHRILLPLLLALVAVPSLSADAAVVRFRGSLNPAGNPGGTDPLGLLSLPSRIFEIQLETDNAGSVTGSYIVFEGLSFAFSNGTVNPGSPGTVTGMNLPNGILNIDLGNPLAADNQASFDALIGAPAGTMTIENVVGPGGGIVGGAYFGGLTAVPEPSAALALAGLVGTCGVFSRRRRRS